MVSTFQEAIDLWPAPAPVVLAEDIGTTVERVRKWRQRNSVPGEWFQPIAQAATRRQILLSVDDLARIAANGGARADGHAEPLDALNGEG